MYRFEAKTDQKLGIWSQAEGASLFSIATKKVQADLPSLLPPAQPRDFSLDFMEFQIQALYQRVYKEKSMNTRGDDRLPYGEFLGECFGGRYRMQFTEPYITWDGSHIKTGPYSAVMLNRGDWTYYTPNTEIIAGDSIFGLNDMTFPIVRMTGIRYNGMLGFPEEKDLWLRSPGSAGYYIPPQVFTGPAPAGSKVELVINDRSIETQDVLFDTYRFDNIRLAPGSLNTVRIIIPNPADTKR